MRAVPTIAVWLSLCCVRMLLAATVVHHGTVSMFTGPDEIDLEGNILYAVNFSADDPVRLVGGVSFMPDTQAIPGASFVGPRQVAPWQTRPEFGSTGDDQELEEIMHDIRWASSAAGEQLRADLDVVAGVEYKLQILISGNRSEDRNWDIRVEDVDAVDEITSLGLSPGEYFDSGRCTLFTYQFVAGDSQLNIVMGNLFGGNDGGDRNPIWQALTLERVTVPPAPEALALSPTQFFANQTAPVGTFTTTDLKTGAGHVYSFVDGRGVENEKFAIAGGKLELGAHDFSVELPGRAFRIGVRTEDAEDATRYLDAYFILTVATSHPPTAVFFNATTVNASAVSNTPVGLLSAADADTFDVHAYTLVPGAGSSDNALFMVDGNWLRLARPVPSGVPQVSFRVRATDLSGLAAESSFALSVQEASLRLNEFMAGNVSALQDEDGDTSDWIEIYNERAEVVSLEGWYLTDDPDDLTQWRFPAVAIASNGFRVIFASGKDRVPTDGGELHTNFKLGGSGEYLALVGPNGTTVVDQYAAQPQFPDLSYGYDTWRMERGYLHTASPGAANGDTFAFGLNDVVFSHARGFYTNAFTLTLTSGVPGSVIRYTTDGSKPSDTSGAVYDGPITVSPGVGGSTCGTRRIRAVAWHAEAARMPVATHTYLFINGVTGPTTDGVVGQSVFASSITADPNYGPLIDDALMALPVVSIVRPGSSIGATESETSIEYFTVDGGEPGFQIDCGIKLVGGASVNSPKNNFRCYFRSRYGTAKLLYPLFRGHPYSSGTDAFDVIMLRSGSHDNFYWLANPGNPPVGNRHGDAQFIRNRWINDMQMLMGHESPHGRFVNLYMNGAYHGLYQVMERPNHHFHSAYLGGDDEDYHYTNSSRVGSDHGDGDTWAVTWSAIKSSLTSLSEAARWVDFENLLDYMILNYYTGNDWDWSYNHNWMAGGPKLPDQGGWKFYAWDSDIILQDVANNNLDKQVPDRIFNTLMGLDDFQIMFRDRVYTHLFHGGLLTPVHLLASYNYRMNEIALPVVAETARWQPSAAHNPPWDRDGEWCNEWHYMTNTFFTQRGDILLNQLRVAGWYPTDAPEFGQNGGVVSNGHEVIMTAPVGTIYYTLDGSDPRLPGGGVAPSARAYETTALSNVTLIAQGAVWRYLDNGSDQGTAWRETGFDDLGWVSGPAELGYGDGDEATVVSTGTNATKAITTYFRHTITGMTDVAALTGATLRILKDDAAVVYVNGQEVARPDMPPGAIDYLTPASNGIGGADESLLHSFDVPADILTNGTNVVAVEVHQQAVTSSDISFDLDLVAHFSGDASRLPTLTSDRVVKARALDGGEWSALHEAFFIMAGRVPASVENMVVSEIQYNPRGNDEFEFIEFRNTLPFSAIDLTGVVITNGVNYAFPPFAAIPPNGYLLVVEDEADFATRYSATNSPWYYAPIAVSGAWRGGLANDGETVTVLASNGTEILSFTYGDGEYWPGGADGRGSSCELIDPTATPLTPMERQSYLSDGRHWRASSEYHGSPGRTGRGRASVRINEVLSHSSTGIDWIELANTGALPVDVGGWYLSDDLDVPLKYEIGVSNTIPVGGFVRFEESQFNQPAGPGVAVPFAFGELGEEAVLCVASGSNVLEIIDREDFGAAEGDVTFGRYVRTDGAADFTALRAQTPMAPNDLPKVGPIVISEVMYHPSTGRVEYVELVNITGDAVGLYHPSHPSNTWRLTGAVKFTFPTGVQMAACGRLIVSRTNASAFAAAYGQTACPVYGPWEGALDNAGEALRLRKPGNPETNAVVPYILVDKVAYDRVAPWPTGADGQGPSLERRSLYAYGNDPANWRASAPGGTPGDGTGNHPPVLQLPNELHAVAGDLLDLQLAATDADLPWQTLAFGVEAPLPAGADFDAPRGHFTWTPGVGQAPGPYDVTFRVSDDAGCVAGEDRRTVLIHVYTVVAPTVAFDHGGSTTPGTIAWTAVPGQVYQVEYRNDLPWGGWQPLALVRAADSTEIFTDPEFNFFVYRYYRVTWVR